MVMFKKAIFLVIMLTCFLWVGTSPLMAYEGDAWVLDGENVIVGDNFPREIPANVTVTLTLGSSITISDDETLTVYGKIVVENGSFIMVTGNMKIYGEVQIGGQLVHSGHIAVESGCLQVDNRIGGSGTILVAAEGRLARGDRSVWQLEGDTTLMAGGTMEIDDQICIVGSNTPAEFLHSGAMYLHSGRMVFSYHNSAYTLSAESDARLDIYSLLIPDYLTMKIADNAWVTIQQRLECQGSFMMAKGASVRVNAGAVVIGVPELKPNDPDIPGPMPSGLGTIEAYDTVNSEDCTGSLREEDEALLFSGVIPWLQGEHTPYAIDGSYVAVKITAPAGISLSLEDTITYDEHTGWRYTDVIREVFPCENNSFIFYQPIRKGASTHTIKVHWAESNTDEVFTIAIDELVSFERGITFVTGGGTAIPAISADRYGLLVRPADPVRENSTFLGWYRDSYFFQPFDFDLAITEQVTVYAKWSSSTATQTYTDLLVNGNYHWAFDAIMYASEHSIVSGYPDGSFRPDNAMTRAEFVKTICAIDGVTPVYDGSSPFQDLPLEWYKPYIAWAYEHKIVNGTSATTFDPEGLISRQDMATMVYRFMQYRRVSLDVDATIPNFDDINDVQEYAKEAVILLQKVGLFQGKGGNRFAPYDHSTRAEVVTALMRLLQKYPDLQRFET